MLTINNVPVKILHMNTITSEGKSCMVLDDSDVIPVVTVSAPRSVVDALSAENIIATADVNDMGENNMVPIVITANKYSDSITNITGSIKYVLLRIEDEVTATFTIAPTVTGNVAEGYQIGQVTLEQNQVRVTGPVSEVENVASAGVIVDVTDTENNISTNAEIHLYDAEGRDIRLDENLKMSQEKCSGHDKRCKHSFGTAECDRQDQDPGQDVQARRLPRRGSSAGRRRDRYHYGHGRDRSNGNGRGNH